MKMLLKRIVTFMRGQKPDSPDGQTAPSPAGSSIVWKGKMSPFSQERAAWVEARLFCLAKMAHDLNANGMTRATSYVNGEYQEAFAANKAALAAVHVERLQLMAERQVIQDHVKEAA